MYSKKYIIQKDGNFQYIYDHCGTTTYGEGSSRKINRGYTFYFTEVFGANKADTILYKGESVDSLYVIILSHSNEPLEYAVFERPTKNQFHYVSNGFKISSNDTIIKVDYLFCSKEFKINPNLGDTCIILTNHAPYKTYVDAGTKHRLKRHDKKFYKMIDVYYSEDERGKKERRKTVFYYNFK